MCGMAWHGFCYTFNVAACVRVYVFGCVSARIHCLATHYSLLSIHCLATHYSRTAT
jgi:hypothetical protein